MLVVFEVAVADPGDDRPVPGLVGGPLQPAGLTGKSCGLAEDVLVEQDPNAGTLSPVSAPRAGGGTSLWGGASLRRVRYGDSVPMGMSELSCLPVRLCPGLLQTFDPTTSLYEELAEQYGIQLMVTDEVVEVGMVTADDARLLQIAPQSPVFLFPPSLILKTAHRRNMYSLSIVVIAIR